MPKLVEVNPTPDASYEAVSQPVGPVLDHEHDMQQIGVEHHWLEEHGAYEALPVMECKDPDCAYQEGLKREYDQETQTWTTVSRDVEWDDEQHTEYVTFERDENGGHLR